jgi:hypothetical protein
VRKANGVCRDMPPGCFCPRHNLFSAVSTFCTICESIMQNEVLSFRNS